MKMSINYRQLKCNMSTKICCFHHLCINIIHRWPICLHISCTLTHIHKSIFTHKPYHIYSHTKLTWQVQPQNTTALSLSTICHYLENHSHVIWRRGRWNLSNLGSHLVPSSVWSRCQSQSCSMLCSYRWSGSQLGQCYSLSVWRLLLLLWWRSQRCSGQMFQTPTQFPSMTRPGYRQRLKTCYVLCDVFEH